MLRHYSSDDVVLTVDSVIRVGDNSILLIERSEEPYMDKLVLPGGHVNIMDESLVVAAQRVIVEELSLYVQKIDLEFLTILDDIHRDPRRGRRISIVFTTQISHEKAEQVITKEGAKSYMIIPFEEIGGHMIGFDHYNAIEKMWNSIKNPSICICGKEK
jgi:oxygen-independent coproporphyrinogen-3 oxidase